MSAIGLALVVAFSNPPVPVALGTALKTVAMFAMVLTLFLAMRAPAQVGHRGPVVRTVLAVVAAIVVAALGGWLANWAGAAVEFIMAMCVACIGAVVVYLGWAWWDDTARIGGWAVFTAGGVGMILALMPLRFLGVTLAGVGGGIVLLLVAGLSAHRARW